MIKLLEIADVNFLNGMMLYTNNGSAWNWSFESPLKVEGGKLILASEDKQEKLPMFVKLRIINK